MTRAAMPKELIPRSHPRVLHLVETLEIGGTESQVVETILRQHQRKQFVTIGCLHARGPLLSLLLRERIPVVEFRKRKKLFSINGIRQLFRLVIFLRRGRFDVLHAHDLMSSFLGVTAARLAGTSIIISSRRYLSDLDWWTGKWRNRIASFFYKWSTHVIVNASAIGDLLVTRDGVPLNKIRMIYNGVDAEGFMQVGADRTKLLPSIDKDRKLIAVVANMNSPIKGHRTLITAAAVAGKVFPDVLFVLIGEGPERARLEQQIRESGLERHFLWLGSRRDVAELLACCDMFVLPSESEGLPNALLEAMAAGLPVIATSVGGVPEVIEDEENGLLIPPCDPKALSVAICRLLQDDELRGRLARSGQKSVIERFSFPRMVEALDELYHEPTSPNVRMTSRARTWDLHFNG